MKFKESNQLKHFNDCKVFTEYSNHTDDTYKNIEHNPNKKHKILIAFDDIISDMVANKKYVIQ